MSTRRAPFWEPQRYDVDRYRLRATTAGCVGPPDHQMFMGGVTTAAAIVAMEDTTELPVALVSAQFLRRTMDGDDVDVELETHSGRTITQSTATIRSGGRGSDYRSTLPRFRGEHLDANLALVAEMNQLATDLGLPAAQIALAWIAAQGDFIAPIPGTRRRTWLEQNVAAADVTLSTETLGRLDEIFAPERVSGDRYALSWMKSTDTNADDN